MNLDAALKILNTQPTAMAVAYCSVGYRSAQLASLIQQAGHENVFNLEGSIFKWTREGRPVFRDGKPVNVVHPFNENWGALLPEKFWSYDTSENSL